ncbi:MAG TPA: hypothetical protein VMR70_07000 [Flavisolibacter sp.]|nr:hypothetical protein [Flavisolibacter sp.]
MKCRIKFLIYSLLAGLTALTVSCSRQKKFQLIESREFAFPSASALEFYDGKLYVFGDDAAYLLVLSPDYKVLDSVFFRERILGRIPKDVKHDIESSFIRMENGQPVLYGIGSMSNGNRSGALAYEIGNRRYSNIPTFDSNNVFSSIASLNIEGSCVVGNTTVFANRANLSSRVNYFIFDNQKSQVTVKPVSLPRQKTVAGISGISYVKEKDLLLFTASEEETESTTADGAIGDSYLGWMENFSTKIGASEFVPDRFIKLSEVDNVFSKQKVESVCVEKVTGNELLLHLAADNDDGTSRFFKLQMRL